MKTTRALALAMGLCRVFIALLPRPTRRTGGAQIEAMAEDLLRDQLCRRGLRGLITATLGTCSDLVRYAWLERGRRIVESLPLMPVGSGPRRGDLMSSWIHDLRHGVRSLLRQPGFTTVVLVTLAVTMAAATTLFALLDAVLLRPLPFEQPGRLVAVWSAVPEAGRAKVRVNGRHFGQWREQSGSFERLAVYVPLSSTLRGAGEPVQLAGTAVSEDFFPSLGVEPSLGRGFVAADFDAEAEPVVLLSHALWRGRFGGDRSILGRTLSFDDQPLTVIGVLPRQILPAVAWAAGFVEFDAGARYWQPMTQPPRPRSGVYGVLGRLAEGVSLRQAESEMDLLSKRLEQASPATNEGYRAHLVPLVDEAVGDVRTSLWLLLGAVGVLLAIACANVTGLYLVRIAGRRQEFALRGALGAGRWRLWRQVMTEGLLLVGAGALAGTALAFWGVRLVPQLSPRQIPRLDELGLEPRILLVTWAVYGACGLFIAWLPAAQAAGRRLLRQRPGQRSTEPATAARWRQVLVAAQVALAALLLIGSGLLLRSLHRLSTVDPGFAGGQVLMVDLLHHPSRYGERHQLNGFYDSLFERLGSLPDVHAVSASYDHPLAANWTQSFALEGGEADAALFRTVTPSYFETLGIQLLEGRGFTEQDRAGAPGVAVVNQAFVRRYVPGGALGRRFATSTTQWTWGESIPSAFEIVGVVEDVRFAGLAAESEPAYYLPYRQTPQHKMTVFVRSSGPADRLLPLVQAHLRELAPELPILGSTTLEAVVAESLAKPRFSSLALSAFAAGSLLLAMLGLWGTLSYSVRLRRQEIGIRMALGAGRRSVFRHLLWHGLRPAVSGLGLGVALAFWLRPLVEGLLFEIAPGDPVTFLLTPIALLGAAAFACVLPAVRAAASNPVEVLRQDQG